MSDDLLFDDEQGETAEVNKNPPWQVLVVDDEPAVHEVTKLVMVGFEMDGRGVQFSHCYSAAEARKFLSEPNDVALILLDVVMETDQAGLDLARYIREEIKNLNVRIVLRTGQPGQAPEEQVIRDYDINDYKEKTDLTRRKLISVFYAALRGYRDLMRIEHARRGLRRSIEAICHVYDSHNLRTFASAVLEQVNYLLGLDGEGLCASRMLAYSTNAGGEGIKVLAVTPAYSKLLIEEELETLPADVKVALKRALVEKSSHHGDLYYAGYSRTKGGSESLTYMVFPEPVSDSARELLEIFSSSVCITYEGLLLHEAVANTQRNAISILGDVIERTVDNSAGHLRHVGDIAALLLEKTGGSESEVELMRVAATLHDLGKAFVSTELLTKAGALKPDEWAAMKTHSQHGHDQLARSGRGSGSSLHNLAARIALEHHERWDGTGYPMGRQGEAISIPGRIVAIADVLVSLTHENAYRSAWTFDKAMAYVSDESGKHFDPTLVAVVLANQNAIQELLEQ